MIKHLQKLYWFLTEKCSYCGGELEVWSAKKAFCKVCGKKDK